MDLGLKGKKAIVVGGARGIGRAAAEALLKEGVHVALGARSADSVKATVSELQKGGGKVWGQAVDVSKAEEYAAWLASAADALGGLDILVTMQSASGGMSGDKKWYENFEVDLMGSVRACDFAVPRMTAQKSGAIVLISTTAALETFFVPQPYNAIKAALFTYGKQLSQAVAKDGIRVNVVSPGPVEFEGGNWPAIKESMREIYDVTVKQQPSGRMGTPQEIANAVLFLASPVASWITGVNLVVDGGFTKRVAF
jgi:3-oxoacyl-[acyl-carrier protein] reductase